MNDSIKNQIRLVPISISHAALISDAEKRIFSSPWSEGDIMRLCGNAIRVDATRVDAARAENGIAVNGGVIGFCAYLEECFSGYATMYCVAGEGQINNIAVLPEYRRMGLGDALLDGLCGAARRAGLDVLFLEVRKSNSAAYALYEKHGFFRIGERKGFYTAPPEDAILMKKELLT